MSWIRVLPLARAVPGFTLGHLSSATLERTLSEVDSRRATLDADFRTELCFLLMWQAGMRVITAVIAVACLAGSDARLTAGMIDRERLQSRFVRHSEGATARNSRPRELAQSLTCGN